MAAPLRCVPKAMVSSPHLVPCLWKRRKSQWDLDCHTLRLKQCSLQGSFPGWPRFPGRFFKNLIQNNPGKMALEKHTSQWTPKDKTYPKSLTGDLKDRASQWLPRVTKHWSKPHGVPSLQGLQSSSDPGGARARQLGRGHQEWPRLPGILKTLLLP